MNEYEVAHAKALKMNAAYVNIQGHGTRAYELLSIENEVAYVIPLSRGMAWSHNESKVIYPSCSHGFYYGNCGHLNCKHCVV